MTSLASEKKVSTPTENLPTEMVIKNYRPPMSYRRFGKTGCMLSVITLGGMRYVHGWEKPRETVPKDMLDQCVANIEYAFANGINHIETAYGYGKSEHCYSTALNDVLKVPRESYYFMTKGDPIGKAATRDRVEEQLRTLKMDYIDFYAWHGLNNDNRLKEACHSGSVEELLKMKAEGKIRHVGFSTHAPASVICRAIETGLFDFVNLHYYYFFQRNLAAITLAEERDMGIFIISPNDKGGQLFNPPPKLRALTHPLTPIQWNARFCLRLKAIHTLSFGMTEKSHHDEMEGIFPITFPMAKEDYEILHNLDSQLLLDPYAHYEGFDLLTNKAEINIPEILRLRKLWKCYNMKDFAVYRYNMLETEGHWFPGRFPTEERLNALDTSHVPPHINIKALLRETHQALYKPKP
ncbi:hypothetical protein COTS27_01162 [Spirochaetota bacterium]|nr:hypothetical protein COTS27_01162 [Spirochaetota bacterium]